MENCAIDHHHLIIIMHYLRKTFMIIADAILFIVIGKGLPNIE